MRCIKIVLPAFAIWFGMASLAGAAGDLLNSRLESSVLGTRLRSSRLSLLPVRDKDKKQVLEAKKKRVVSKSGSVKRVTRFNSQRKRKTKRVVASQ